MSRRGRLLALLALLLVAVNLRGPIAAVGPVVSEMSADLAMSPGVAGLLTGLPVLCFALAAPLASALLGRLGVGRVVAGAMTLLVAGLVLRSAAGATTALLGTLLVGLAITAGNLAVPVVTRRDFPLRIAAVTGATTAAMNIGAMTTTALTAPLAQSHGWRLATAVWGVAAVAALGLWCATGQARVRGGEVAAVAPGGSMLRRPAVWAFAFVFATQSFGYYGMTAWLPLVLRETLDLTEAQAGGAATPFQAAAIVAALLVPWLLARRVPARTVFLGLVALWLALPLGLVLAPGGWPVWVTAAGLSQGGLYTVVISVILQRSRDVDDARRTTATVQTVGYVLAALGPSALGELRIASAGWTAPLLLLVVLFSLVAVVGGAVMRPVRR